MKGVRFYWVADSYREQDGWVIISGSKIHYWLYDTYTYHDGNTDNLLNIYIPNWDESEGYIIDFENCVKYSPNNDLAQSVKSLMNQRGCDVSVAIVWNYDGPVLIVNNYDKDAKYYWTEVTPLVVR